MLRSISPITGRRIRFALVGCGRISANHIKAIQTHTDRAELVAVCDTDPEALEKAVKETGAQGFNSYREMLSTVEADCVILATPSGLHPEQTIMAAEAGFHVMTEKPMATRWADGLR